MSTEQACDTHEGLTTPEPPLEDQLIRDLVEAYPETMTILGPLGIDLCCGGGHPLGEALDLHGLDRETILPRVASVLARAKPGEE